MEMKGMIPIMMVSTLLLGTAAFAQDDKEGKT
jgi:hypothetical protein